jgi:hypothetical protein
MQLASWSPNLENLTCDAILAKRLVSTKKIVCISLLFLMIFPALGFYAYGQGYTITRLTDNNYADGSPNINNHGQVVWFGFDGHDYEIFLYDGVQISQLTNNDDTDLRPVINNNGQVVWESEIGNSEIFIANPH